MPVELEGGLKLVLLVAALLFFRRLLRWRSQRQLCLLLAFGGFTWLNFGTLHTDRTLIHNWEQFHYFVGSKYFPELGYDGIYMASIQARQEEQAIEPPARVRDLRTQIIVPYESLASHSQQVRARFSSERWKDFKTDVSKIPLRDPIFLDHGYNAPPPMTAVLRVGTSWLPIRRLTMLAVALVDLTLVAGIFWMIARAYGLRTSAYCALLLGLGFLSRFYWTGGAALRFDWIFAVVTSLYCLRKRHFAGAGAVLGYAIAVRLFPLVMIVPFLGWCLSTRKVPVRWMAGMAGALIVMTTWGGFTGRGADAYREAAAKLSTHRETSLANNIGLRTLFITSSDHIRGKLTNPDSLHESNVIDEDYLRMSQDRRNLVLMSTLLFLLLSFWVGMQAKGPAQALTFGLLSIYAAGDLTCYYWVLLILLPLVHPSRGLRIGLVANLAMFITGILALLAPSLGWIERFNPAAVFFPCALFVGVALIWWIMPTLRRHDFWRRSEHWTIQ